MRLAQGRSKVTRLLAGTVATIALVLPLSGCGSDDKSARDKPKPVAQVDKLSGQTTAVKLDKGFTDALASLKLTPGVVGKGGDVAVNGKSAVKDAFLFQLDGRTLKPLKTQDAVKQGLLVGIAEITIDTK